MKRNALVAGVLVLAMCVTTAPASAEQFALGAYGGYQWPIVQDDADHGVLFGFKGKVKVLPWLDLEPNITSLKNGDTTTDSGATISAPDVWHYALNGNLTFGGMFHLTAGIGWASIDLPSTGSENSFAFNAGLAFEVPIGALTLDISPRFLLINHADGASRKHGMIMAGLNYWF